MRKVFVLLAVLLLTAQLACAKKTVCRDGIQEKIP